MNGNQLNALIERLQVHDHPKLLEYIMPNKEQNVTTTGEKQVQHHCNVLLRNILRMQGYNLSYVHQVIENVITIYKNNNEEDALTKMKKGGTLNCIIIIKQNVYIFNNIETLMPVSYVLSLAIRKYVEDNNGIDDSNAIGLYNLSQNFVLDLSDDVGDSMNTNDILGTTGYTVPCIGLKTKTKHPTKELAILKKVLMERQLDAQRLDKKISPLLLNVEDEEDDEEHIIDAVVDNGKKQSNNNNNNTNNNNNNNNNNANDENKSVHKIYDKTPPYEKYIYEIQHAGISMVEGKYTFYDLVFRTPRYRNENLVFLSRITLFGKLGWALYHDDAAVDDERVLYYGLPSSDSYPPCNIQFRCLAGSGAPIIECIIGPTPAKRTAILVDDMNKKKKKKKKKGGKKKKKKIKIKQEDEQIDNKQNKHQFHNNISSTTSLPSSNKTINNDKKDGGHVIKLTRLNQIINSKREDKIREEILLLELEHKIIHYFKHINVKPTNVEKVAKQYLWEETVLFDMMKTKFNVDIFSIDIPPFLNNEDARAKAIENIENKRKMNRKGSKEIKLFIPSSGE